MSDRGESIERALSIGAASVVWLDEFDRLWATEQDVRRLKQAGRMVYAVSPDLHGFSLIATRARWAQFSAWGVDGICTDYPVELPRYLNGVTQRSPRRESRAADGHDGRLVRRRLRSVVSADGGLRSRVQALRGWRRRAAHVHRVATELTLIASGPRRDERHAHSTPATSSSSNLARRPTSGRSSRRRPWS